jgi:hypothetical protein
VTFSDPLFPALDARGVASVMDHALQARQDLEIVVSGIAADAATGAHAGRELRSLRQDARLRM